MSNKEEKDRRLIVDDDYELVCSVQKGDLDAFEALVGKHQKKMLNTAYRMIGDYEEACEAVQDAFFSAYKAIKKFRGESRFSTWLCSIVMNLARNRRKQMATRFHREGPSIDDPVDQERQHIRKDPPAQGPPMVEQLERREVQAKVQECMNNLGEEYREVLVLRDVQGFSYEEIRDILNTPDGTVKSRLFRAREAMKDCLKKKLGAL